MDVTINLPAPFDLTTFLPNDLLDLIRAQMVADRKRIDADTKVGYANASRARGLAGFSAAGLWGDFLDYRAEAEGANAYLRLIEKILEFANNIYLKQMDGEQQLAAITAQGDEQIALLNRKSEINTAAYAVYLANFFTTQDTNYSQTLTDLKTYYDNDLSGETDAALIEAKARGLAAIAEAVGTRIFPPFNPPV